MPCNALLILSAAHALDNIRTVSSGAFIRADHAGLFTVFTRPLHLPVDIGDHRVRLSLHNRQLTLRRIMPILHSRCLRSLSAVGAENRHIRIHSAENLPQHLLRHISRAQNLRRTHREINNRGLQTNPDRSAVYNHLYPAIHVLSYILRHRRARSSGEVGTRRSDIAPTVFYQLLSYFIGWETHRHRIQPACRLLRDKLRLGKNHCQRSRPERFRDPADLLRHLLHDLPDVLKLTDMDDQGIVRRSALRGINFAGRLSVQRISAQPIDSFRGKCHKPARTDDLSRTSQRSILRLRKLRLTSVNFNCYCIHPV